MTDLSLQNLADKLPANSLTETADDVTISLKAVLGENVQLADAKVAESLSKVMGAAASAQVDYNTANPDAQISSYPSPTFGAPVSDGNGGFTANRNHNLSVRAPLNLDEITAVTV